MVNKQLKYNRARMAVMDLIASKGLSVGDMIPTQRSLAELLPFSEVTIRHALSDMESSGLIIRRPGSGTYVAKEFVQDDYQDNLLFINVYRVEDWGGEGIRVERLRDYLSHRRFGLKMFHVSEFSVTLAHAAKNAQGIILYGWLTDSFIRKIQSLGLPVVVMGNSKVGLDVPVVSLDIEQAAYRITRIMLDNGLKRIALFRFMEDYHPLAEAAEGYGRALAEAGLPPLVLTSGPRESKSFSSHERAFTAFMAEHQDVEGVLMEHVELMDFVSWFWQHDYPRKPAIGFLSMPGEYRLYHQNQNYIMPKYGDTSVSAGKMLLDHIVHGEPMVSVKLVPDFPMFDDSDEFFVH